MRKSAAIMCVIALPVVLATSTFCSSAWAANASPSPDFTDPTPQSPPPTEEQRTMQKSVDIAPEPPASPEALRKLGYFHKYRNGLSALGFGVADTKTLSDRNGLLTRGSLYYLFGDAHLNAWEAGADLQSDSSGALSIAARWIFSRSRFRPYTKAGVGVRIEPADQFATFLRFKNYQLRGSAGFEVTIKDPMSVRFEAEANWSERALQLLAGAGLAWGW